MKKIFFAYLCLSLFSFSFFSCAAQHITDKIQIQEGPLLNVGRMSSRFGIVQLQDGRVAVFGGSEKEDPFISITGTRAIEILDLETKQWNLSSIDVPYPTSGRAFLLKDGRVLVFADVFSFHSRKIDSSPVSAMIVDFKRNEVEPLYRPHDNEGRNPALTGKAPAFLQRAFSKTLQLKNGRMVRIGGRFRDSWVDEENQKNNSNNPVTQYVSFIEIYTPPDTENPLGKMEWIQMKEGRTNVSAIELQDGNVLITGGQGPLGTGKNTVFETTYLLSFSKAVPELTSLGRMFKGREDHESMLLDDGKVLISGGTDKDQNTVRDVEIFDPVTKLFQPIFAMKQRREDHLGAYLGDWVLFFGGEIDDDRDIVLNSAEIFNRKTGQHIGEIFLFLAGDDPQKSLSGFAGIDDFGMVALDPYRILLVGGQQGKAGPDGDLISQGIASKRTLFLTLPQTNP